MRYIHIFCECGGIIGMRNEEKFTCDKCGQVNLLHKINYDILPINNKTGWVFPMKIKEE